MSRATARGTGQGLLASAVVPQKRASVHKGGTRSPAVRFWPRGTKPSAALARPFSTAQALGDLLGTLGARLLLIIQSKRSPKRLYGAFLFGLGAKKARPWICLFSLAACIAPFSLVSFFSSQSEVPETPRLAWMAEASESALVAEIPPLQNMWSSARSTQPVLYAVARSSLLSMSPPLSPSLPCT